MEITLDFASPTTANKVCKLKKSLYGLRQSPRAWSDRFTKVVKKYGYAQCQADHNLFVKNLSNGKKAIRIVYVNDIILTSDYDEEMLKVKEVLAEEFDIKDLGYLTYFLGMQVARLEMRILVSQIKYVLDLLNETGMLGYKFADKPIDPNNKLGMIEGDTHVEKGRYQRLAGKLIYLS